MALLDRFRTPDVHEAADAAEGFASEVSALLAERELLLERTADLELALEDRGWLALGQHATQLFSREGIGRAGELARALTATNPLARRALGLRAGYVWGDGVSITARANGEKDGEQDVNGVVQAFLDDKGNRRSLTGESAQAALERGLFQDGDVFFALFTNPVTGFVRARSIPAAQVRRIICNPDDASEPWYYLREWTQTAVDGTTEQAKALYPDVAYRPKQRPVAAMDVPIQWDAPVAHASTTGEHGGFGLPDAYPVLGWARAYAEFLADWAKLVKSLSRFAWRTTNSGTPAKTAKAAAAVRAAAVMVDPSTGAAPVGAAAVGDVGLEAIPKTGATIDSDSGRPLAAMVAAGMDVPVTMLLADPGVTGARATAETLDGPTELVMGQRRGLWREFFRAVLDHVIDSAVRAPKGPLQGTITTDPYTTDETVTLAGDTERTVEVIFPDWASTPVETLVKAIVEADGTSKLPPLTVARLLLQALAVDDIDEILETLTDDEGNWVGPALNAGAAALDDFERGGPGMPPAADPADEDAEADEDA